MNFKKYLLVSFFIISIISINSYISIGFAQQVNYPLNHNINISINKQINQLDEPIHTGFKPLLKSYLEQFADFDSVVYQYNRDSLFLSKRKHPKLWRKLRCEDLIVIDTSDFFLSVNPLFNFEFGKNSITDSSLSINTRGIIITGDIGKSLSFVSSFYENQAFFIDYVDEFVREYKVVPGQGRIKSFKTSGFDYAMSSGYISFTPSEHFNLQLGHSKHFIGEGYRSLLLSDNSFNYPFLKLATTFSKFQYINMFTAFQQVLPYDSRKLVYQRKHGTFNYLSYIINKNIELGLFEAIIWQTSDTTYENKLDMNFVNPVILVRPFQYSMNSENNILLGLNAKVRLTKNIQLYGQLIVDNFDLSKSKQDNGYFENKYGYQVGMKFFDLFNIPNLYILAEYNHVRPYTYGHTLPFQNYSHFSQALSHPLGANFKEIVAIVRYKFKDFFIELKYNYAVTGRDTGNSHYGANIFLSDENSTTGTTSFNNQIGQGVKTNIEHKGIRLGYLINPRTNLHLFIGIAHRLYKNEIIRKESNYFFFGIRTSLNNYYYDF